MRARTRRTVALATVSVLSLVLVPIAAAVINFDDPIPTTEASPNIMLGGQLTDTADVSVGAGVTGTIDFRLYGPDDATCSRTPVFQSSVPFSGEPVTSQPFTPTQTGTYRWIATFRSGGGEFSGACNAPNENVLVTAGPPPPPPPSAPKCLGKTATIVATGQAVVFGTSHDDVIVGTDAGETIFGRDGQDTICARKGDDTARGGKGNDKVLGDDGADTLSGNSGDDLLLGLAGDDVLFGKRGDDRTGGGDGEDHIHGGEGDDNLNEMSLGGNGRDHLHGNSGEDRVRTAGGEPDQVDCGTDSDNALIDTRDDEERCEDVTRRPAT